METQIVEAENKRIIMMIKEKAESEMSFTFSGSRKEFYELYTSLRAMFQDVFQQE